MKNQINQIVLLSKGANYASGSCSPVTNGNLVWVRNGSFSMGSSDPSIGSPVPRPVHQVTFEKGLNRILYKARLQKKDRR
jgi:formylglycine-generating enzyme required for sulfatase activity